MAKVNYLNEASFCETSSDCFKRNQVPIIIKSETKVFSYKYVYSEADCDCEEGNDCCYPGKGDDVGFTLIFGNYGEETYSPTDPSESTIIDILDLSKISNASLKVMDICADCHLKFFDITNGTPGTEVIPGKTEFAGGNVYTLEVRLCDDNDENCDAVFCLPCHSVFCASILFQVEFGPCTKSKLENGSFVIEGVPSLDGWTAIPATGGGTVQAVASYPISNGNTLASCDGDGGFALLKSGYQDSKSILKQTFDVKKGDKIDFCAFFDLPDLTSYPDEAQVIIIKDSYGNQLFSVTKNANYVSTDWEHYDYTFMTCARITFEATVKNVIDNVVDGYLAIDAVTVTPL